MVQKLARSKKNDEINDKSDKEESYMNNDHNSFEKSDEMKKYEKETGRYAIWRGIITEGFRRWQKGEKVYHRDKERISLYVTEDTKSKWLDYTKNTGELTISKLIREAVTAFIKSKSNNHKYSLSKLNPQAISNISHTLKEPLTSIKGYSQLLLENYKEKLNVQVLDTVRNIFEQSILLEKKIINILDNIKVKSEYDVLLIEDDLATIRLITSYFESKGFKCKGVVSGSKGLEELGSTIPKLILLDIILPDLSGYDICKTIKSDKEWANIPVYFLTAIAGNEVEKNLADTKSDGFILKPFNFSDFEVIFDILKKS
ncbi:MAG: response regulator [Candidatus Lokiarchaeota archaeon]|nr:response regulator [Candidatus Lokiarchaeota archaeon]